MRMTPGHPKYNIFDVETPFVDDKPGPSPEGGPVRNVFLNGVFAYLYHAIASDPHGCLGSLLPDEDGDPARACTELGKRTVLKRESGNQEEPMIGPVILATIAYFIQCSPWHTFHGLKDRPPHDTWYAKHLQYFSRWPIEAVNLRIAGALKRFYNKFPDARQSRKHRVSLGGRVSFGEAAEPMDPQSMPPE